MRAILTFIFLALFSSLTLSQQKQPLEVSTDSELYQQLKANGELNSASYSIVTPNSGVSDHTTVYPSMAGERVGECDCWIEPDDTYTLSTFGANGTDDGSSGELDMPFSFELYGTNYNSFWINTNGNITFEGQFTTFTPDGFPVSNAMLAPFWADVDFCPTCGDLYYKITDDAIYVNWVEVGYFANHDDLLNSFQVIFTPNSSSILEPGNNVQFCYRDMQWSTGDITGDNGFGGEGATVGANAGNNQDYIQFGRFDQPGEAFDGPFGDFDGVDWLDNQTIEFNANLSANDNIPPQLIGFNGCDTITLCANDVEILDFTFLAPEAGQNIDITVDDDGFAGIDVDVTNGATANVNMTLSSGLDTGVFDILITATDDGTPAASTSVSFVVEVLDLVVPDLDIFFEGDIADQASYCEGAEGAFLSASDGFDSYSWDNGSELQEDFFLQGTQTLTAFFMGCDTQADIDVFEIPVFNPDVIVEDIFLCAGEQTDLILEDSEDYLSINWSVFLGNGNIVSLDLTNDTITVEPGQYEVVVLNDSGCEGSRIVSVVEEIVNVPNTVFAPQCDDDDVIEWNGAWADPNTCAHFIYLYDEDGDEWQGANLEVYIDGVGPLNFNIANASTFVPTGITPYHGQTIEYYFTPGLDDDDIDITLFGPNNTIVFDSTLPGDEITEGLFFTQIANCGFNALPGTWTVDAPPGGEGYTLEFTDVFNPVDGNNVFTAPAGFNGTYQLTFESGICNDNITFPLSFSQTPTVEAFDYTECSGTAVLVEPVYGPNPLPGDIQYDWSPNLNDGSPTAEVTQSVNYDIEISNSCGSSEASGVVTISPSPIAVLSGDVLCDNETALLDPGNANPELFTYAWTGPGVNGSTASTVTATQGGTYSVVVSSDNCGSANADATFTQQFSPSVSNFATDTLICPEEVIDIDPIWNNGVGPITWVMSWADTAGVNDSFLFNETGEILSFGSDQIPADAASNQVLITYSATNFCGNATGSVIAYTDACFVDAPNVFSPDNDGDDSGTYSQGLNEGWYIVGLQGIANVHVQIFDRWGSLVYEDLNYDNDQPWRGKHTNGSDLSDGTYFYTVNTPRAATTFSGSVTILRKK